MLVVNFFGGPGSGKSTLAAALFAECMRQDINAELVTEAAKDHTWDDNRTALVCQPLVFGQQLARLQRLCGKVDVAICDSPLLLSRVYAPDDTPLPFHRMVVEYHQMWPSLNYRVMREPGYQDAGRVHSYQEALEIDRRINAVLSDLRTPGIPIFRSESVMNIVATVQAWLHTRHARHA